MSIELEPRYLTIKRCDVEVYLDWKQREALAAIAKCIDDRRIADGRGSLTGLHIESNWPEYEPTKAALLARINGAAAQMGQTRIATLALAVDISTPKDPMSDGKYALRVEREGHGTAQCSGATIIDAIDSATAKLAEWENKRTTETLEEIQSAELARSRFKSAGEPS